MPGNIVLFEGHFVEDMRPITLYDLTRKERMLSEELPSF